MATLDQPDDHTMSFGDHLEELRKRVLLALAAPLPLMLVFWVFREPILAWLYRPLDRVLAHLDMPRGLQALGPAETLGMTLKLSLIGALIASAPWILWQTWLFVRPGLYRHERRFVHLLIPGSAVMTVAGVALMYYVMLPLMLQVLVVFGASIDLPGPAITDPRVQQMMTEGREVTVRLAAPEAPRPGDAWLVWPGNRMSVAVAGDPALGEPPVVVVTVPPSSGGLVTQEFRLSSYIDFVLLLMLGIVVAFQMPLVVLLLGWLGLIMPRELRRQRKYAIFICAAVSAVITPADVLSMLMMLVPLYGLYELSILLLVFAPASAVAEGRLLRRSARSHKETAGTDQTDPSAQIDRPVRKGRRPSQTRPRSPDDEGGGK